MQPSLPKEVISLRGNSNLISTSTAKAARNLSSIMIPMLWPVLIISVPMLQLKTPKYIQGTFRKTNLKVSACYTVCVCVCVCQDGIQYLKYFRRNSFLSFRL